MKKVRPIVVRLLLHVPYLLLAKPGLMLSNQVVCLRSLYTLKQHWTGPVSMDAEEHLWQPPKYLCGQCPVPEESIMGQSLFRALGKSLTGGAPEQLSSSQSYTLEFYTWPYIWKGLHWTCWRCASELVPSSKFPELVSRSKGYFFVLRGYTWKSALLPAALDTFKVLRRAEETGHLLREPQAFKQLAFYPYNLWTRLSLYTFLKLGKFIVLSSSVQVSWYLSLERAEIWSQ